VNSTGVGGSGWQDPRGLEGICLSQGNFEGLWPHPFVLGSLCAGSKEAWHLKERSLAGLSCWNDRCLPWCAHILFTSKWRCWRVAGQEVGATFYSFTKFPRRRQFLPLGDVHRETCHHLPPCGEPWLQVTGRKQLYWDIIHWAYNLLI
jgi:hypothetical protein